MTDINKSYVRRYVDQARSTDNQDLINNCLYRVGTHMELDALKCDGNDQLTPEQQQIVLDAANKFLGGEID